MRADDNILFTLHFFSAFPDASKEQQPNHGYQQLRCRERTPYTMYFSNPRKQKRHGNDNEKATQNGNDMGGPRPFGRGKVHGNDYIKPGKRTGGKVQAQAFCGNVLQHGVLFTVENICNLPSAKKYHHIDYNGKKQHGDQRISHCSMHIAEVLHTIIPADNGLNPLRNAGINCDNHQRQVGDNTVGRNPYIPPPDAE